MIDKFKVLVLTKDHETADSIVSELESDTRHVIVIDSAKLGLNLLEKDKVDLLIADSVVSASDLAQLSLSAKESDKGASILTLVESSWRGRELASTKLGIDSFLEKPIDRDRLREIVERLERKKRFPEETGLLGRSERMREVVETIIQIAPTNFTVLITGESGTGKELAARAIHRYSGRMSKSFLPVVCAAIPEGILESELFGHEKGAFTDAKFRRKGVFESAQGGTIFLDEIGEMAPMTQVKLLRVLDDREFMRVGGSELVQVDVRVIAATNKNLRQAVARGEFREDLYYRLKVVEIAMPPLRERKEDIPLLVNAFIEDYCRENNVTFPGISDEAMEMMKDYPWPGNVRELKHVVESMIALSPKSKITISEVVNYLEETIEPSRNLPVPLNKTPDQSERELILRALLDLKSDFAELKTYLMSGRRIQEAPIYNLEDVHFTEDTEEKVDEAFEEEPEIKPLEEVEKEVILRTLEKMGGNRKKAAEALGIGERTIYRKLRSYGL